MTTYTINYKNSQFTSAYSSVQQLTDFLSCHPEYNYAGFVQFRDGIKIKGVANENHFRSVYGNHAEKIFFIGRGADTFNGIFPFAGCNNFLNPDNHGQLLSLLPKPNFK